MFDRRLLTDIGLALLIALPSALPAAPNPWNVSDQHGKPSAPPAEGSIPELASDSRVLGLNSYGRS